MLLSGWFLRAAPGEGQTLDGLPLRGGTEVGQEKSSPGKELLDTLGAPAAGSIVRTHGQQ